MLIFLGTGASGGTPGKGKSKRQESSLLVSNSFNILIDATRYFQEQSKLIEKIDLVLITHAHKDAYGGISKLNKWLKKPVPIYAHKKTIATIKKHFKNLRNCKFFSVQDKAEIRFNGWKINPIAVPHPKVPTFDWKLESSKKLVYASDISRITPKFKKFCRGVDLLIIDGAMWSRSIFSHIQLDKELPKMDKWKVKRIIVTQIGKTAPSHEKFRREIRKLSKKAMPAYDGMKVKDI